MNNLNKKRKKTIKKKNKKFQIFMECVVCIFIIFSVFELRSSYGKVFLKENNKTENTDQNKQSSNSQDNKDNNNKKSEQQKVKFTAEQKTEEINKIINEYKKENNKISVIYNNISTGYRYSFNEKEYFSAASTPKVIYALYVYDRIAKGEISEDQLIKYTSDKLSQGGGEITSQPKKDNYPLSDLIRNMIVYSDNTATNMILGSNENAEKVVNHYIKKLGVVADSGKVKKNKLTPEIMEKVWLYIYQHQNNYPKLIEYLKESENNEWIKTGIEGKTIASKYGAIDDNAHDTAIVYSSEKGDYILLIYTQGVANSADVIADIANKINKINDNNS